MADLLPFFVVLHLTFKSAF